MNRIRKGIVDYNGQSYTVDEYTITLEQTLYDSKTYIGYCVFSITKEGGKPEVELNHWNQAPGFGKNLRFWVKTFASQSEEYEFIGDTLYLYLSFDTDDKFDNIIRIGDGENIDEKGEPIYLEYIVKESMHNKEFRVSDTRSVFISPLGIAIHSIGGLGDVKIVLYYKNGEEKTVVDTANDIGVGLSGVSCLNYTEYLYQFIFKELVDIREIEYITLDDERVDVVE